MAVEAATAPVEAAEPLAAAVAQVVAVTGVTWVGRWVEKGLEVSSRLKAQVAAAAEAVTVAMVGSATAIGEEVSQVLARVVVVMEV